MAYPNFYPQLFPSAQPVMPGDNNSMIWVMGQSAAESYPVGPNQKAILWDSNSPVYYVKAADASGRPFPLKRYRYFEDVGPNVSPAMPEAQQPANDFVSREEFENFKNEIKNSRPQYQKKPNNQKEG